MPSSIGSRFHIEDEISFADHFMQFETRHMSRILPLYDVLHTSTISQTKVTSYQYPCSLSMEHLEFSIKHTSSTIIGIFMQL